MSKKKKIAVLVAILAIIIISLITPVNIEIGYEYGDRTIKNKNDPKSFDYTIYKYKNIYGITIKTEVKIGVQIYWKNVRQIKDYKKKQYNTWPTIL